MNKEEIIKQLTKLAIYQDEFSDASKAIGAAIEYLKEDKQCQIKEADVENTAERFKEATNKFFKYLISIGFHYTDVEYLDGYFIFGMGTNSVIHFHIKECPKWKFAIWWRIDEQDKVRGDFFTRHESDLDKFKPTRSEYCYDICPDWDDSAYYSIKDMLNFIKKHPYRAWERTVGYTDFNVEYVSGLKCFWEYCKFVSTKERCNFIENWLDKKFYKFIEKKMLGYVGCEGDIVEIQDLGDCCSPRYQITCKIPDNDNFETGCYNLFEEEDCKGYKLWHKTGERYRKFAKLLGVYWYPPCDDCVIYWKDCERNGGDE